MFGVEAMVDRIEEDSADAALDDETSQLVAELRERISRFAVGTGNASWLPSLETPKTPEGLANLVGSNLAEGIEETQRLLETVDLKERLRIVHSMVFRAEQRYLNAGYRR